MILKRNLSVIVITTLLLTFISTTIATPAQGKSSRVAVITELTGSATVKSAGGSREFDAYIDMGLSQGDYITTNAKSSVKLKIKDHEDEFTIGANSVVSITTLADKGKGKKSKIKMFAGSVWSNVKKLSGGDDYEVETPTAVMAVRGTKIITSVNSQTGETYLAVAAGSASVHTNTDSGNSNTSNGSKNDEVLVTASQQFSVGARDETTNLENKVAVININELIASISADIVAAIVKDKEDIDRENAEFIASQKSKIDSGKDTTITNGSANSSLTVNDASALEKVTKNLNNLIGNVVKTAIEKNVVDKVEIQKVIDKANEQITNKLDLTKVEPLDKTAGVDPELQKQKDADLKKLEEIKAKEAENQKKLADLIKQKLEDALKKLAEEKARIAKEKEDLGLNKPTPAPVTSATPTPTPTATPTAKPTATPEIPSGPTASPTPILTVPTITQAANNLNISLGINNLTDANQVYGVEVHVVYSNTNTLNIVPVNSSSFTSDFFGTGSVTRFDNNSGSTSNDIIFAAVLPKTVTGITSPHVLVNLQLLIDTYSGVSTTRTFDIYVKVVHKNGSFTINTLNAITPKPTFLTK